MRLLDLTDQFCDSRWCYAVVGDVIVYRDYSHLSDEYSALLAPYLSRAFARVDVRSDPLSPAVTGRCARTSPGAAPARSRR